MGEREMLRNGGLSNLKTGNNQRGASAPAPRWCQVIRYTPYSPENERPMTHRTRGGGALNFFQVGVCGPDFQSVGLRTDICLWKKGLVRACKLKISKFGMSGGLCSELKIPKFGGLRAKTWVKIEAVEAKISKFSQKGVLWTDPFAWDPCELQERHEKGVFRAAHPHTPFLGQCPLGELYVFEVTRNRRLSAHNFSIPFPWCDEATNQARSEMWPQRKHDARQNIIILSSIGRPGDERSAQYVFKIMWTRLIWTLNTCLVVVLPSPKWKNFSIHNNQTV